MCPLPSLFQSSSSSSSIILTPDLQKRARRQEEGQQQQQQQQGEQVRKEAWTNFPRDLMVGAIMGGVAHTIVAPVERAKLLLQTQDSNMVVTNGKHPRYKGLMDCIVRIARDEGILSLWRGNTSSVLRYYPSLAFNFAFKVPSCALLFPLLQMNPSVSPLDSLPFYPSLAHTLDLGFSNVERKKLSRGVVHIGMHIQTH
jgi:hypothetical protein